MTNLRVSFKIPLSYNQLIGVSCVKTKKNLNKCLIKKKHKEK